MQPRFVLLCLLVLGAAMAPGEPAPDPRLLLADAMRHAASQTDYAVDIDIEMVTRVKEREQRQPMRVSLVAGSGEEIFLHIVSGADEAEVYRNGTERAVHFVNRRQYVTHTPPPSRIETIGTIGGSVIQLGAQWLAGYLHADPGLIEQATEIRAADEADAVDLVYPDRRVRARFGAGTPPVLAGLRVEVGTGASTAPAGISMQAEFGFGEWRTGGPADPTRFAFVPPPGVTRIDPAQPAQRKQPLVGQAAPKVTLPLLDGGTMDLAQLEAEDKVVVLDFWATWCGPCHVGLPIVSEVAAQFADRGVVFYAVNRRESPERIRGFLESKGHAYAVALDDQDEAARAYEVNSIPRTVIIDKDGVVRAVHAGVGPRLKQEIADELARLTAAAG